MQRRWGPLLHRNLFFLQGGPPLEPPGHQSPTQQHSRWLGDPCWGGPGGPPSKLSLWCSSIRQGPRVRWQLLLLLLLQGGKEGRRGNSRGPSGESPLKETGQGASTCGSSSKRNK